jgi:hypothetical protein
VNSATVQFQIIEDFPSIKKRADKRTSKQNKATTSSTTSSLVDTASVSTLESPLADSFSTESNNLEESGSLNKSTETLSSSHDNCFEISSDRDEPSTPNINNSSSTPPLTPVRSFDNNKLSREIYRDYEILNSSDEEMFSLNNSFDSYDGIAPLNSILDTPFKPSSTSSSVGVIGSGKVPKSAPNPFGQYTAPTATDNWAAPPPPPLPFDPSIISTIFYYLISLTLI